MIEEQSKKAEPKSDDEDQAILAFSNELPGNDGAPVVIQQSKEEIEKHKQAEQELQNLQTGDATAAFADLVTTTGFSSEPAPAPAANGPVSLAQTGSASFVGSS